MTAAAYPLAWPAGWRRTQPSMRKTARFSKASETRMYGSDRVSIAEGVNRTLDELGRMDMPKWNVIISTNVPTTRDGWPRSDARAPEDPGVAVYFRDRNSNPGDEKCLAIDRYDRVADNLAAIAATLAAMRAIERHGGASIMERAFRGFVALPHEDVEHWSTVLGVKPDASPHDVDQAYRRARSAAHPDKGGTSEAYNRIERAFERARRDIDPTP